MSYIFVTIKGEKTCGFSINRVDPVDIRNNKLRAALVCVCILQLGNARVDNHSFPTHTIHRVCRTALSTLLVFQGVFVESTLD